MKPSEIQRIVRKDLKTELISFLDKSKGADHLVYILNTGKGKFVLRVPKESIQRRLMTQWYAMNQWGKIGIPVPRQIKKTRSYLIEGYVDGKDIDESQLDFDLKKKLMKQVGVFLRQMHEVKTKKYGYLTKPGVGEYSDLKTWFNNKKYVHLADLQKKRLYSATKVNQFKKLYQKYSDCLADVEPSLLHHDLTFENVIVKNGRITGIIDAGDVMSGDPAYELACMHQHYRSRRLAKPILEGYGVIDMKKLYFYALFQSLWWVKYFSLIKKGDHFSRVRRERANVEYYLKKLK